MGAGDENGATSQCEPSDIPAATYPEDISQSNSVHAEQTVEEHDSAEAVASDQVVIAGVVSEKPILPEDAVRVPICGILMDDEKATASDQDRASDRVKIFPMHCDLDDMSAVARHLQSKYPNAPKVAVGFSAGSNIVANFLGRHPDQKVFLAGISISNAYDLQKGEEISIQNMLVNPLVCMPRLLSSPPTRATRMQVTTHLTAFIYHIVKCYASLCSVLLLMQPPKRWTSARSLLLL